MRKVSVTRMWEIPIQRNALPVKDSNIFSSQGDSLLLIFNNFKKVLPFPPVKSPTDAPRKKILNREEAPVKPPNSPGMREEAPRGKILNEAPERPQNSPGMREEAPRKKILNREDIPEKPQTEDLPCTNCGRPGHATQQ
jgi:hypothetical protein